MAGCQVLCGAMPKKITYATDSMALTETIRERLRELMAENDVSQTYVARTLELDPSTINKFLSGERPITDINMLARMARLFGVSVGYLIGETSRIRAAKIAALVTLCDELSEASLDGLIVIAKTLPRVPGGDAPTAEESPGAPSAPKRNNGRKPSKGRKRK
jgi:transcriptional regulator with XRE-family HTH domain